MKYFALIVLMCGFVFNASAENSEKSEFNESLETANIECADSGFVVILKTGPVCMTADQIQSLTVTDPYPEDNGYYYYNSYYDSKGNYYDPINRTSNYYYYSSSYDSDKEQEKQDCIENINSPSGGDAESKAIAMLYAMQLCY